MITKEDYLKAKELVNNYKIQEGLKKNILNKNDLFLKKPKKEIIEILLKNIDLEKRINYIKMVDIISESYFQLIGKKIGVSNSKLILTKLIEMKIINVIGDLGFREYKIN